MIIQLSTGARGGGLEERGQNLELKPEMASLTTGSSNFSNSVNYKPPQFIEQLARRMLDYQIKPEIEIFDLSMIANADYLFKKGLLREPLHYNLVLNVPGSLEGTAKNLFIALLLNGHLRVGLEDVLELDGKPVTCVWLYNGRGGDLMKKPLTAPELAEILSLSVDTVWRYTRQKKIPVVKLGEKQYRYEKDAVLAALAIGDLSVREEPPVY